MTDTKQPTRRILGDQRIFQAVFNDLKMKHELVELADGTHRWVYTYDGVDPYEMEDSEFPLTVKLIVQHTNSVLQEVVAKVEEKAKRYSAVEEKEPKLYGFVPVEAISLDEVKHIVEGGVSGY